MTAETMTENEQLEDRTVNRVRHAARRLFQLFIVYLTGAHIWYMWDTMLGGGRYIYGPGFLHGEIPEIILIYEMAPRLLGELLIIAVLIIIEVALRLRTRTKGVSN